MTTATNQMKATIKSLQSMHRTLALTTKQSSTDAQWSALIDVESALESLNLLAGRGGRGGRGAIGE